MMGHETSVVLVETELFHCVKRIPEGLALSYCVRSRSWTGTGEVWVEVLDFVAIDNRTVPFEWRVATCRLVSVHAIIPSTIRFALILHTNISQRSRPLRRSLRGLALRILQLLLQLIDFLHHLLLNMVMNRAKLEKFLISHFDLIRNSI